MLNIFDMVYRDVMVNLLKEVDFYNNECLIKNK